MSDSEQASSVSYASSVENDENDFVAVSKPKGSSNNKTAMKAKQPVSSGNVMKASKGGKAIEEVILKLCLLCSLYAILACPILSTEKLLEQ